MSKVASIIESYTFNRGRTLATLESIAKEPDPPAALAWRPGPGRAHIGWQLTHIGITEELFASERLAPHKQGAWQDFWPRFRGGSTPDDDVPSVDTIRDILGQLREHLLATLADYGDDRLGEIPPPIAQRGWTMLTVLHVLGWHESHHQGQAHLTFNLYKASRG